MIEILIIAICIALNALLAGSETAFVAVNKQTLKAMTKKGHKGANKLLQLRENPEKTLSVIQIGITFVGTFAAAVGGAGAEEAFSPWLIDTFGIGEKTSELIAISLVVLILTYISVVLGELVPKTLGLRRPMFFALKATPWLHILSQITHPMVIILEKSTKGILRLFPKKHVAEEADTEETGPKLEDFSIPTQQYVFNIAKLERTLAKDILVKWDEVAYVEFTQSADMVERIFISSGHTRLPVVKGNAVIGILNSKEFMAFQKTLQKDWTAIIRPPIEIPDTMPVLAVLRLMQEKRMHMVIVYQAKMKTGIVTMEEIMEEVVGDIYDENDDGAIQRILSRRLK